VNLRTDSTSARVRYYLLAVLLGTAVLTAFIFYPQSPYQYVSPRRSPLHGQVESLPAVLLTLAVGLVSIATTLQEIRDNKFALLRLTNISNHRLVVRFFRLIFHRLKYPVIIVTCWMLALLTQNLYSVYVSWQRISIRQPVAPEFYLRLLIPEVQYILLTGNYPVMPRIFLFSRMAGLPIIPLVLFRAGFVLFACLLGINLAFRFQSSPPTGVILVALLIIMLELIFFVAWRWPTIMFLKHSLTTYLAFRDKYLMLWIAYYLFLTLLPSLLGYLLYIRFRQIDLPA